MERIVANVLDGTRQNIPVDFKTQFVYNCKN